MSSYLEQGRKEATSWCPKSDYFWLILFVQSDSHTLTQPHPATNTLVPQVVLGVQVLGRVKWPEESHKPQVPSPCVRFGTQESKLPSTVGKGSFQEAPRPAR